MRAALYFAPPPESELSLAAAGWLGRNAWTGDASATVFASGSAGLDGGELVREPKRYGFHATLKPPFRLAADTTLENVRLAVVEFGESTAGVVIPAIRLERIGSFFALTPASEVPALRMLADQVVRCFEPFRAPLMESEVARRRPDRLTARQRANLDRWGYPYVFEDFRFHMTLTGPVPEGMWDEVGEILRDRFGAFLDRPLAVDRLCLFVEPSPPGDFIVDSAVTLR